MIKMIRVQQYAGIGVLYVALVQMCWTRCFRDWRLVSSSELAFCMELRYNAVNSQKSIKFAKRIWLFIEKVEHVCGEELCTRREVLKIADLPACLF